MTARLLIVASLIAAAQVSVIGFDNALAPAPLPIVGPNTLPQTVEDFVGHDEAMNERDLAVTQVDLMLNRVFRNRLGDTLFVNVGIWTHYDMGIPHKPDLCYPSAGWEIVSRKMLDIPVSGASIRIKLFIFQRNTSRIAVAYWVHLGDEIITDNESVRKMLQRRRPTGGSLPLLVKVMLHTDARDIVQAENRLVRMATELLPYTKAIH
jgi:EpsI family protein